LFNGGLQEEVTLSRLHVITLLALSNLVYSNQILAEDSDQTAAGQTEPAKPDNLASKDDMLGTTVVTATRSEMSTAMAPANVSVINTENTENRLVQRLGDVLKDIPGVQYQFFQFSWYRRHQPLAVSDGWFAGEYTQ
jgi:iron complex outermembrane receptor protein